MFFTYFLYMNSKCESTPLSIVLINLINHNVVLIKQNGNYFNVVKR